MIMERVWRSGNEKGKNKGAEALRVRKRIGLTPNQRCLEWIKKRLELEACGAPMTFYRVVKKVVCVPGPFIKQGHQAACIARASEIGEAEWY